MVRLFPLSSSPFSTSSAAVALLATLSLIATSCSPPADQPGTGLSPNAPADMPADAPVDSVVDVPVDGDGNAPPVDLFGTSLACPTSDDDRVLVSGERIGVCFLVPAGFEAREMDNGSLMVLAPADTLGHRERLFVNVEHALGRNRTMAVEQVVANHRLPGDRSDADVGREITFGGIEAIALDRLPGQELNRQVILVDRDRLMTWMFMPDEPARSEENAQMEALFTSVAESLVLLEIPEAPALPLPSIGSGFPEDAEFLWSHTDYSGGGEPTCRQLAITEDHTFIGSCTAVESEIDGVPPQWAALRDQVRPMIVQGGEHVLVVRGTGDQQGPPWHRVLERWAEDSYGELAAGRVSATGRTAMSWWQEDVPSDGSQTAVSCRHLLVLAHGYAYASTRDGACPGGPDGSQPDAGSQQGLESTVEGWLTADELERFLTWTSTRQPYYEGPSYLDGRGSEELPEEEAAEVRVFARGVLARLGG